MGFRCRRSIRILPGMRVNFSKRGVSASELTPPSSQSNQLEKTYSDNPRAFVTLDGLRGIAALMIAARHAPLTWQAGVPTGPLLQSYLAVDFFFVLSGFVLAYAYGDRFSIDLSTRQFMIIRLIRLYPLYLLAWLFSVVLLIPGLHSHWAYAHTTLLNSPFALLFLPTPSIHSEDDLFPMNSPAWSLFFELIASYAFGLAGRHLRIRMLVAGAAAAALMLTLAVSLGWFGFGTGHGAMDAGVNWRSFGAGFARVAYSFTAGVLVFRLWKINPPTIRLSPVILLAALCGVLLAQPPARFQAIFDLSMTLIVFPGLVYIAASSVPSKRTIAVLAWLGGISYGVYVLQMPLFNFLTRVVAHTVGSKAAPSLFWGCAFVAFVVAATVFADEYVSDRPDV